MKTIKKHIKKGIGRAIGYLIVYGFFAIILTILGYTIDISKLPPTAGHVTSTIIK